MGETRKDYFRCHFEIFSIGKQQLPFVNKSTGQQVSAMLSVFNILIHKVYRKFDKKCIEMH